MKLRLMLWLLGVMLKRARRRNPRFRDTLATLQRFDWGVATEDLSLARHYRMRPDAITDAPGLPIDLDLELRFCDAASGVAFLKRPTPHAFFEGLRSGRLRLVGDSRDLERLQGLLKHLR